MADLRIKEEDLEPVEVLSSRKAQPRTAQNHWSVAQKNSKHRKATPKKLKMLKSAAASCTVTKHARLATGNDPRFFPDPGGLEGSGGRMRRESAWSGGLVGGGRETLDRVRAELSWYKKENLELRRRLEDVLDIKELETTLRMTLNSFGVPVPDRTPTHTCVCDRYDYKSSRQPHYDVEQTNDAEGDEDEQMVSDFGGVTQAQTAYVDVRDVGQASSQVTGGRSPRDYSNYTQDSTPSHTAQVELIPSSGVFVDADKLSSIAFRKGWSYTLLTRSLMPMIFTKEEMIVSCVRGERATGRGALTSPARPALDQVKVQAILTFVSHQFPDIQPYQITQTMNQKLVDVRGTIRKRKCTLGLAGSNTSPTLIEADGV